jgi:hypothetical protein
MSGGNGDGFHTRVCSARYAWVPTAKSHHGQCLRPKPPEAQNGRCLSVTVSPRACRGSGPLLVSLGRVEGWEKSHPPTLNRKVEE